MPKPILRILPNGRLAEWGLSTINGRHTLVIAEGEQDTIRIDVGHWLDAGETVASSALTEQSGVTLVKTNNAGSVDLVTSVVTSTGQAVLTITTSTGRKKRVNLGFATPETAQEPDTYRTTHCW